MKSDNNTKKQSWDQYCAKNKKYVIRNNAFNSLLCLASLAMRYPFDMHLFIKTQKLYKFH